MFLVTCTLIDAAFLCAVASTSTFDKYSQEDYFDSVVEALSSAADATAQSGVDFGRIAETWGGRIEDPWGRPIQIALEKNAMTWTSAGRDGVLGTVDDCKRVKVAYLKK